MVRRSLLLALAVAVLLPACNADEPGTSGAGADLSPSSVTTTTSSSATSSRMGGADSTLPGREDGPRATLPPTAECRAAGAAVEADVASALVERSADADPDAAAARRDELVDGLTVLASTATRLAGPARRLTDPPIDVDRVAAERADHVAAFDVALRAECGMRLSGLGVLRPDPDPGDALEGLGVAMLDGPACETAAVLRWADAHWRVAADGGSQDRLAVVVRHALGTLALGGDGGDADIDVPADIGTADLSGWSLSSEHRLGIVRLDGDLRRECAEGLALSGLLKQGLSSPSATTLAALPEPTWAEPAVVDADTAHARWCAVVDDIYAYDVAAAVGHRLELDVGRRLDVDLRLLLGSLRVASRSGGSIATLDDVRDVIEATKRIERGDISEPGRLTGAERRALGDLDRIMVANCGVGLSTSLGVLGRFTWHSSLPDFEPTAPAPSATSTTSTTLPTYLPDTAVAVVGDSLTFSAQTEIVQALAVLGLGDVVVDGQVSRRMTSSTDTIRSGETVVGEIAAVAAPRIWVIALGTNDVASGSPPESLRASVQRVLDAIPADALVVWVDTYIRDELPAVAAGNQLIRDVVAERPGAIVVDFFSYGDDPGIIGSDGVHLTTRGRQLFAGVIANGITAVLGRNPAFDLTSDTTVPIAPAPTASPAPATSRAPGTAPPPLPPPPLPPTTLPPTTSVPSTTGPTTTGPTTGPTDATVDTSSTSTTAP